jgi:hypothetical protein
VEEDHNSKGTANISNSMALAIPKFVYIIYPTICTIFFILDYLGYDRQAIYEFGWWLSIIYFSLDLIVEVLRQDFLYILHHSVCLTLLLLKLVWSDERLYVTFMHLGLTMEISNIFLNARPLLKRGGKASTVNDLLFVISWFLTRWGYSIPKTLWLVLVDRIDGGYPVPIGVALTVVVALHVYWGFLILKKVARQLFPVTARASIKEKE